MPQGVLWEVGGQENVFPKYNQISCVSDLHERHMQQHNFLDPPSPGAFGRGQRVKYH